jgi:hypothetical protein
MIIYTPEISYALADLAQTLTSQDKARLMDLANNGAELSQYPEEWQNFIKNESVQKHGSHDQSSHGSWASGMGAGVAGKIVQFTQEWGGLSIKMTDGSMPTSGFMVAKPPEYGAVVDAADFLDPVKGPKILADYMKTHREDLASGKNYLGTWLNEGKVYLDVSENIQDVAEATKIGRERNQKAIWDVVNLQEIDTGGTGLVEKESQHGRVARHLEDDRRTDRGIRKANSRETNTVVVKFAPNLKPALKHYEGLHDQSSHGSWAAYGGMAGLIASREGAFDSNQMESTLANLAILNDDPESFDKDVAKDIIENDEYLKEQYDATFEEIQQKWLRENRDDFLEESPDLSDEQILGMVDDWSEWENEALEKTIEYNRFEIGQTYVNSEVGEMMNNTFNLTDEKSGMSSIVRDISASDDGSIRVSGIVADESGNKVGEFARTFNYTGTGVAAYHDVFLINTKDYQGKGFGRFFTENVEAAYIAGGVERVNLFSAWDGAYTWSRAGFDFDPDPSYLAASIQSMNEANWRFSDFSDTDMARYQDLVIRSDSLDIGDPSFPLPHEYASLPGSKDVLYNERVYFEKILSAEGVRLREGAIDADGDGFIYDGTAREQPAPSHSFTQKPLFKP